MWVKGGETDFILKETELILIYCNLHDSMNAEEHTFQRLSEKGTLVLFVLFVSEYKSKQNEGNLEKNFRVMKIPFFCALLHVCLLVDSFLKFMSDTSNPN